MRLVLTSVLCSAFWLLPAGAQDACPPLTIRSVVAGANIFSEQQQVWLGEAIDDSLRLEVVVTADPEVTARMQAIVDHMAEALPVPRPTFQVVLVDFPTANASSTVAGHIYVGRKLVAQTYTEDELAGVLAHEMGHLVATQMATEISNGFKVVLGVKQVGGQKDVIDKWNQFHSNWARASEGDIRRIEKAGPAKQIQADTIGIYLASRTGYSPQAYVEFLDRLMETKGKTGGFWSDLFGETSQDSKRLREALNNSAPVPSTCVKPRAGSGDDYVAWRNSVVEYIAAKRRENIPGLISKRALTPRLSPTIDEIHISSDGQYVLAQDESGIFVLSRLPLRFMFHIEAWDAQPAMFTPDSKNVVFSIGEYGGSPRVERWGIASQKRAELHEIYVAKGCLDQQLSPDGKSLACVTAEMTPMAINMGWGPQLDLDLYDVATSKSYWHEVTSQPAKFDAVNIYREEEGTWEHASIEETLRSRLSRLRFSPDSRYLLVNSDSQKLCYDLTKRAAMFLPRSIKGLMERANFAFVGSDRIVGMTDYYAGKARLVRFPSGDVIADDIAVGAASISSAARGDFVLLRPLKNNPVGVFDLSRKQVVLAGRRSAMDVYDDSYVSEQSDGSLQTFELATAKGGDRVQLPLAPLRQLTAGSASPDLNWLAISQKTRGGLWDLQDGHQLYKVMGFQGAYFDPLGALYADFFKLPTAKRTIAEMSYPAQKFEQKQTLDERVRPRQFGKYLLEYVPNNPAGDGHTIGRWWDWDITMEVHDVRDGKLLWSKHFPEHTPQGWVTADSHSLVLYWPAGSKAIKALAKQDSDAAAKLKPYQDKDGVVFLRVFDLENGNVLAQTAIDTARNSFVAKNVGFHGSHLVLLDDQNRVLLYNFDGKLQATFNGRGYHITNETLLLHEEAQSEKLALYDLTNFQKRTEYIFESPVIMSHFSSDGQRLLVVTADQMTYLIDPLASSRTNRVATQ